MNHLHLSSFATERDMRLAIVEAGRICYNSGLMHSNTGNISMRLGSDRVVITPSRLCKGRLEPEDLLIIDLEGTVIKADTTRLHSFSTEAPLHLEIYRQRPDIRAIIHAHPVNATALTVAGIPFPVDILPEVLENLGPVPTTGFSLPSPADTAAAIRNFVPDHHAILIRNHGVVTFGADIEECLNYVELVESVARTVVTASLLGKVNHLPDEFVAALRANYLKPGM
jgi:L-fuculose-phosphate aldolase